MSKQKLIEEIQEEVDRLNKRQKDSIYEIDELITIFVALMSQEEFLNNEQS